MPQRQFLVIMPRERGLGVSTIGLPLRIDDEESIQC